ncbi:hypothetical protein [Terrabacter sp. NPDC080008]|uniref:hypothetical protein n=1 Tax=Terrabacter sp. NPDC080008 TaxID=3155176 RepID=UPI00344C9D41
MGQRSLAAAVTRWAGVVVAALLSACTAAMPPGLDGRTGPSGPDGALSSATPTPVLTTIDGMTPVPEALDCVAEHLDGRRSDLPGPELFPPAYPGEVSVRLVLPGRDSSDAGCGADLTQRFSCRDATSWAVPDPTELLLTFAARQVRVLEGTSAARTQSTEDGLGPGPAKRSFTYAEYALADGDPWGAEAFEQRAFQTCAPGPATVVDGVAIRTAMVGTTTGFVDAAVLVSGDRLVMVALSGSRWSADERDRAWHVVAQHLRQEA